MLLIKIGGGKNINWDLISEDLVSISQKEKVIMVHGANSQRDELGRRLGIETKTVVSPSGVSSVYTDREFIDLFLMSYPGLVNKTIVAKLQGHGLNAVGLSGLDGRMWVAKRKSKLLVQDGSKIKTLDGNYSGKVTQVNPGVVEALLQANFLPVITAPAISEQGEIINCDNDTASALLATTMKIPRVVFLFEAPGMLRDHQDFGSLIPRVESAELDEMLKYANGRMKKKILAVQSMLAGGVETVYFGDARVEKPISKALEGHGTVIEAGKKRGTP